MADEQPFSLKRESLFEEFTQLMQLYENDARLRTIYNGAIADEIAGDYNDVDFA